MFEKCSVDSVANLITNRAMFIKTEIAMLPAGQILLIRRPEPRQPAHLLNAIHIDTWHTKAHAKVVGLGPISAVANRTFVDPAQHDRRLGHKLA